MHKKIEILSERIKNSSYLEDKLESLEELNIIADTHPDLVSVAINDYIIENFDENTHLMEIDILSKGFTSSINKELSEMFFKNKNNLFKIYSALIKHLESENKIYAESIVYLLTILFCLSLDLPKGILIGNYTDLLNTFVISQLNKTNIMLNFNKIVANEPIIKKENKITFKDFTHFLKISYEFKEINNLLVMLLEAKQFNFVSIFLKSGSLCTSLALLNAFEIIINNLEKQIDESLGTLILLLNNNFMNQRLFLEHKVSKNVMLLVSNLFLENNFDLLQYYLKENDNQGIYKKLITDRTNVDLIFDKMLNNTFKKDSYFYLLVEEIFKIKKQNSHPLALIYADDPLVISLYSYYTNQSMNYEFTNSLTERDILTLILLRISNKELYFMNEVIYLYKDPGSSSVLKGLSLYYLFLHNKFIEKNKPICLFYLVECRKYLCCIDYISQELITDLLTGLNELFINNIFIKDIINNTNNNIPLLSKETKEVTRENKIVDLKEDKIISNEEITLNDKLDNLNISNDSKSKLFNNIKSNLEDKTKKYKKLINNFIKKEEEDIHDL
ncbi:hypothetical protein H312_00733 [Anncaliia algerae PRA339]|uniref:Uncharacterized protein n=1 Tax=Anncaliia algerae PRA339 TaxID=1288291 RepID=A0A059F4A2_9MICR|nr:hypothetical protein H312_00733 [Anncaliia algerae PRA339]